MKKLFILNLAIIIFITIISPAKAASASNTLDFSEAEGLRWDSDPPFLLLSDSQQTKNSEVYIIFTDLFIYPVEVTTGHEVTISVIATNTSSNHESYTVNLEINDEVVSTREVILEPHESQSVTFSTKQNVSGEYAVQIGNAKGSFTVKDPVAFRSISIYWEIIIILTLICVIVIWISFGLYSRKKNEE